MYFVNASSEGNLKAAEDFQNITSLLLSGGEVAPVDLTRAELQTIARRDALEKAKADEQVAADALRVLVGYEFSRAIVTTDLALAIPTTNEYEQFKADDVSRRAEFTQFDQQLRAHVCRRFDQRGQHRDRAGIKYAFDRFSDLVRRGIGLGGSHEQLI